MAPIAAPIVVNIPSPALAVVATADRPISPTADMLARTVADGEQRISELRDELAKRRLRMLRLQQLAVEEALRRELEVCPYL
jgi:hypothetical protein